MALACPYLLPGCKTSNEHGSAMNLWETGDCWCRGLSPGWKSAILRHLLSSGGLCTTGMTFCNSLDGQTGFFLRWRWKIPDLHVRCFPIKSGDFVSACLFGGGCSPFEIFRAGSQGREVWEDYRGIDGIESTRQDQHLQVVLRCSLHMA